MAPYERLRRAFVCFHLVLGLMLLTGSSQTVFGMGLLIYAAGVMFVSVHGSASRSTPPVTAV